MLSEGGNYKTRALTGPWGCHLGILVTKCLGLLTSNRPSTSAVSVPLDGELYNQNGYCDLFLQYACTQTFLGNPQLV